MTASSAILQSQLISSLSGSGSTTRAVGCPAIKPLLGLLPQRPRPRWERDCQLPELGLSHTGQILGEIRK
jgi:hypothetical protein